MDPANRWQRIDELFDAALDIPTHSRSQFLRQACGTDLELLKEIESLLDSSEETLGFAREAGEALTEDGKANEAEPVLSEALASAESESFPLLPWQIAEAKNALGTCLVLLGRSAQGKILIQQSQAALAGDPEAASRYRAMRRAAAMNDEL